MTRSSCINKLPHGQRGVVLVWFAVLLPLLLGFAALAIDLARLNLVRVELQNAADAAALAGARSIIGAATGPCNFSTALADARSTVLTNYVKNRRITTLRSPYPQAVYWNLTTKTWRPAGANTGTSPLPGEVPGIQVGISLVNNGGLLRFFFAPYLATSTGPMFSNDIQVTALAERPINAPRALLVQ